MPNFRHEIEGQIESIERKQRDVEAELNRVLVYKEALEAALAIYDAYHPNGEQKDYDSEQKAEMPAMQEA